VCVDASNMFCAQQGTRCERDVDNGRAAAGCLWEEQVMGEDAGG
jgi:hypothetical protein